MDIALKLEGLYRNASTHAAGVVIGDRPLHELTPLCKDPASDMPVTQFNMKFVELAGLVKFDFLGLKTLTVLHEAVELVRQTRGVAIDLGHLPENVQLQVQLPVEELKDRIAGARMVVLPVRENTYSGATTTLLQCLSMGKTVAVSRVGAIREGYGFEDGIHLQWMEPDSLESKERAILQGTGNPDLRAALGRAARRHVLERLDWDSYVIRLSDVWADWVGGRSS